MIFMSVGHSFSFSSLRRITNSGPNEFFENLIYLKVPGNCSNHLFHDDIDVSGLNPVTQAKIRHQRVTANLVLSVVVWN